MRDDADVKIPAPRRTPSGIAAVVWPTDVSSPADGKGETILPPPLGALEFFETGIGMAQRMVRNRVQKNGFNPGGIRGGSAQKAGHLQS